MVAATSRDAEVWPENWPAVALFLELDTQWRIGMAGPVGLDYAALFRLLDQRGYSGDEWERMFADVRTLEHAALAEMRAGN